MQREYTGTEGISMGGCTSTQIERGESQRRSPRKRRSAVQLAGIGELIECEVGRDNRCAGRCISVSRLDRTVNRLRRAGVIEERGERVQRP